MTLHPIKPESAASLVVPSLAAASAPPAPLAVPPPPGETMNIVSSEVREIIGLFMEGGALEGVSFPDVDADTFEILSDDARDIAEQVADFRRQMNVAREALAEAQAGLAKRAAKALAYAKVFAVADETLMKRLDDTQMAQAQKVVPRKKTRRRRRTPKVEVAVETTAELPLSAAG